MSNFLAVFQYFGKDHNSTLPILFDGKEGILTKNTIEYNGCQYLSIPQFVQQASYDLGNTSKIGSTQVDRLIINGELYHTLQHTISRTPKRFEVEYKQFQSITSEEFSISFDPSQEQSLQLLKDLSMFVCHLSNGMIQFELFAKRDMNLSMKIQSNAYELKCNFLMQQSRILILPL